ncbi:hypothetical protein CPB84DRAFT_1383744 [Gymnopilus junonius]|uniref:Uncharacterized protein n=1 Tax=Gymnopilus junonius TaxID=109634 RepID=A0A9P5TL25_GYMJU|nr:hypothetical protein CPB84DRAFT_1383744 [Gymnopilus junonius]
MERQIPLGSDQMACMFLPVGTFAAIDRVLNDFCTNARWCIDWRLRLVADFTGDRRPDIVGIPGWKKFVSVGFNDGQKWVIFNKSLPYHLNSFMVINMFKVTSPSAMRGTKRWDKMGEEPIDIQNSRHLLKNILEYIGPKLK